MFYRAQLFEGRLALNPIRKHVTSHSSATPVTEINTLDQIAENVNRHEPDTHSTAIPLKALMIPLKRVELRGVV